MLPDVVSDALTLTAPVPIWVLALACAWLIVVFLHRRPLMLLTALFYLATAATSRDVRSTRKNARLQVHIVRSKDLDDVARAELFVLASDLVDVNMDPSQRMGERAKERALFSAYLDAFEFTLIFRDMVDGSLRGMLLLSRTKYERVGFSPVTVIQGGLLLFREQYRGSGFAVLVMGMFFVLEFLRHPLTPFYFAFKSFSYKTYLNTITTFDEVWPRHDRTIPEFEKRMMDDTGRCVARSGESYDPATCVVNREYSALHATMAPITEEELEDPHIRYFNTVNPGWHRGHLLVVLAKAKPKDVVYLMWRGVKRALGFGKGIRRAHGKVVADHEDFDVARRRASLATTSEAPSTLSRDDGDDANAPADSIPSVSNIRRRNSARWEFHHVIKRDAHIERRRPSLGRRRSFSESSLRPALELMLAAGARASPDEVDIHGDDSADTAEGTRSKERTRSSTPDSGHTSPTEQ